MSRSRLLIPAALAALLLGACAGPPQRPAAITPGDYDYAERHLQWQVEKLMGEQKIVGLSIALVNGQEVIWTKGFGFADREREIPATPHTRYRTGDLSKLFTATAALQLAEQGSMELDRPLQSYLPDFSVKSRFAQTAPITPRLLMAHHSGLPLGRLHGMWTRSPEPFDRLVEETQGEYLAQPPGQVLAYSNLGYSLLGDAVQKVAGEPFTRYMQRAVLTPLGMQDARFSPYAPSGEGAARAYRAKNGEAVQPYGLRDLPAGGLNASVLDLGRFLRMLFADGRGARGQVLSPDSVAEMLRVQNSGVALDRGVEVGLGWFRRQVPGLGTKVLSGGATPNYRAYLAALPESKLGVAILANTDCDPESLMKLGDSALRLMFEAKTGQSVAEPDRRTGEGIGPGLSAEPGDFVGHFDTLFGFADVTRDGDHLVARVNGETLELFPLGDGLFSVKTRLLGLFPTELELDAFASTRIAGHDILLWRNHDGRWRVVGEKLEPLPIPDAWRKRLGRYHITNAEGANAEWSKEGGIRTLVRDGMLLVEISHAGEVEQVIALAPLSDSEAVIRGIGTGKGGTVRALRQDGKEKILYSGLVLERMP